MLSAVAAALESLASEVAAEGITANTPAEFVPLVTFLCGEPGRYVTGQTVSIDGGLTAFFFG